MTIAKLDGLSVIMIAGLAAVISAAFGDLFGAVIGSLVCLAGFIELTGVKKLRQKNPGGINNLICSQLFLLLVIWCYVGIRLLTRDDSTTNALLTPERTGQLSQLGVDTHLLAKQLKLLIPLVYIVVALVTLAYQGGLAFFYYRKKASIEAALR